MRLLFFGTPAFAVASLKRLAKSRHEITTVVTQPDRPKGRHPQEPAFSAVKEAALEAGIPILQPEKLGEISFQQKVKSLKSDCAVVVAFGELFPQAFIQLFPKGAINVHASVLPKLRGAAPIQWALIHGDSETGVTLFQMDEKLDHGKILLQAVHPIQPHDTAATLALALAQRGADLLVKVLDQIEEGKIEPLPQDEAQATYAPRLKKEDGIIPWHATCHQIHNRVRGTQPWPGALTGIAGRQLKLFVTEPDSNRHDPALSPGMVSTADPSQGLWIQTGKGQIQILRLQWESGKILDTAEFLRGHPIRRGTLFFYP